jgi:hypothetical protein
MEGGAIATYFSKREQVHYMGRGAEVNRFRLATEVISEA